MADKKYQRQHKAEINQLLDQLQQLAETATENTPAIDRWQSTSQDEVTNDSNED